MKVSSTPTGRAARLATRLAVGGAAAALVTIATPGIASATTTGDVTPMLDCYTYNSNGTYTVILGYTSTFPGNKNFAQGSSTNYATPSKYNSVLPTSFKSGTNHAVVRVDVSAYEVNSGASWFLNGHQLNYLAAAQASGVCSPGTTLPASGNGTGIAVALGAGGVVGAVFLRRFRKRAARCAAVVA
jgi:LPXTG-motif cell wall-anchored protein